MRVLYFSYALTVGHDKYETVTGVYMLRHMI